MLSSIGPSIETRESQVSMHVVLGFLSGVLGGVAGWFALAALWMALSGPDRNGDIAMAAIFVIGPFGGFVGFLASVLLFSKLAIVRQVTPGSRARISRPLAGVAVAGVAAWLAWFAWRQLMG
jgi:hypothetical protein